MGNLVGFHAVTWGNISSLKVALVVIDMMAEVFHGEDISIFFLFLFFFKTEKWYWDRQEIVGTSVGAVVRGYFISC